MAPSGSAHPNGTHRPGLTHTMYLKGEEIGRKKGQVSLGAVRVAERDEGRGDGRGDEEKREMERVITGKKRSKLKEGSRDVYR